ncbi:DUF2971 domain-containing protein [Paucibacter sp. B51]|uniref:DUF2971 domain-containing protein n=1 Tax=Paucibacter sp. B51 TaxID=2993315 RepID=UPI0022EBD86F|nr:DUF2971 domain-containing protein [Paucibacter sp. B51]
MPRSPLRRHERSTFFKYCTATTAKAVLAGGRLRWSSPLIFNDPFDVPLELAYSFSPQEIILAALAKCVALVEEPPSNTERLTPKLRAIVEAIKGGLPDSERRRIIELFKSEAGTAKPVGVGLRQLGELWKQLLPELRILCLCESPSHVAMWHHYADQYRGVVLELACDDRLDSAWLGAVPVTYRDSGNPLAEVDTWANLLVLETSEAVTDLTHLSAYFKSSDWSYEREWRLLSYKREQEAGYFSDYRFDPEELLGVYLGPRMDSGTASEISLLTEHYPRAKVFRTNIGLGPRLTFSDA